MQLTIIIVNYNVKHFLEQCLCSVRKALVPLSGEIIVVDNHSVDNSISYLQSLFQEVRFITNQENLGFARACNQGAALSKGEYLLFLNPDTIVPEDCFQKCITFFEDHPQAGALGVKMLDGRGRFLKESKRAFPSPLTSLYKLFGLARIFPSSPSFARYHLGHLREDKDHDVDVLAGAFLMTRKKVFDQVGGFDEQFFMYGEDVDLSYRIQQAGFRNCYFSRTRIIHFKGESTRKGSMNYVRMFYNAMSIFVRKHYGGSKAGIFNFLIHIAIWIRAGMSAATQFIRKIGLPLIDAGLILLSFWLMKNFWNTYVKTDILYSNRLLWIAFPAFTFVYLVTAYYAGLYDRWFKRSELVRSTLIATIVLLAGYALLPEQYRFSRAIILFGALLAFLLISIQRWILIRSGVLNTSLGHSDHAGTLIVGSKNEYDEARQLMAEGGLQERVLGRIAVHPDHEPAIGVSSNLKELSRSIPFREIIFCEGTLSYSAIIKLMEELPRSTSIKFHSHGSRSIVGSDSKDSSGEAVSQENGFKLSDPYNRRLKRLQDIIMAGISMITFPIHLVGVKHPGRFLKNCLKVLAGQRTWVGYATTGKNLPPLRAGIMDCNGRPVSEGNQLPAESLHLLDYWYAKDYEPLNDVKLFFRMYRYLGN
jgi:GT2 family glycosyltransferase